ncbi:MAG: hypothetical protein V4664_00895 [Patescibacteria group bacterium]
MPEKPNGEIMRYTTLELLKLERELTDGERLEMEEIRAKLNLSHEEILEKGKDKILS